MLTTISSGVLRLLSALGVMAACLAQSQMVSDAPKFEVASVKPCGAGDTPSNGRSGGSYDTSPGRLNVRCMTVLSLIDISVRNGNKLLLNDSSRPNGGERIRGGPAWIHSERYTIDAKADGASSAKIMKGPMLGTLLEERFQLKTHREQEQIPMYALTVVKGGLKLKPMEEGGCTPFDAANAPPHRFAAPGEKLICGWVQDTGGPAKVILDAGGVLLSTLSDELSNILDRHVVDATGITGTFNLHLEFARDEATRRPPFGAPQPAATLADAPASGPSVFTALQQQFGLKLESIQGPGEFIVIDQVERPSGN